MIIETFLEIFSISIFSRKHTERDFTMFWFCTNCKNFVWLMGTIFPKLHTRQSTFHPFFHQNFHLDLLRCLCRNTKRFFNFRPQQLPQQSSTNSYKTLKRWWRKSATGNYGSGVKFSCMRKIAHGVGFRAKRKSALKATTFYWTLRSLSLYKVNGKRVLETLPTF